MFNPDTLLIVITAGVADGWRRAAIGLGVALSALSNGTKVHVFLSLESAKLATPTGSIGIRPRGFSEPLASYVDHFVDLGGKLEVCSSCYEEYCREEPRDAEGRPALRGGTTILSLGIVAERATEMPVLTF